MAESGQGTAEERPAGGAGQRGQESRCRPHALLHVRHVISCDLHVLHLLQPVHVQVTCIVILFALLYC